MSPNLEVTDCPFVQPSKQKIWSLRSSSDVMFGFLFVSREDLEKTDSQILHGKPDIIFLVNLPSIYVVWKHLDEW